MSDGVKRAIACHYSYKKSCLLIGAVGSSQELVIEKCEMKILTSINEMAQYLVDSIPKPTFKNGIWINKHEGLKAAINRYCVEIDFNGEHEKEIPAIEDLLSSLNSEKKLLIPAEVDLGKECVKSSLYLLLKAFTLRLCRKKKIRESRHAGYLGSRNSLAQCRTFLYGDAGYEEEEYPTIGYRYGE